MAWQAFTGLASDDDDLQRLADTLLRVEKGVKVAADTWTSGTSHPYIRWPFVGPCCMHALSSPSCRTVIDFRGFLAIIPRSQCDSYSLYCKSLL